MAENETRTVQQYRHAARRSLTEARESLSLRTDETREIYHLLNGSISEILRGRTGLSQEAQVQHLTEAEEKVNANAAQISEKIAAARESVLVALDSWEGTINAKVAETVATLTEAKEFAASRDFEAHQSAKRRGYHASEYASEVGDDDGEDD